MKERYSIEIADIQLCILSDEPEDFVHATVAQLDSRVRDLTVKNKRCSKLDAALLCALDSLGEKTKSEKKIRNLEAQISLYEATIRRLKDELDAAREAAAQPAASATAEEEKEAEAPSIAAPAEETAPAAAAEEEAAAPAEIPAPAKEVQPEQMPLEMSETQPAAEEARPAGIHDAKLRQIEELLRRRSEETPAPSAKESTPASSSRSEKLREIEELLRGSGGSKSLSEALHDAIGK